jgi:polyribonucleotide nucleotidyltransferase
MSEHIVTLDCNNLNESYTFDKVAKQASGAVMYRNGKAVLIAAVAVDPKPIDEEFLPLTVQYLLFSASGHPPPKSSSFTIA